MLLEFSIGNYRSLHKIQTLDFRATNLVSENKLLDDRNIVEISGSKVLKTIGIYGPNGSGKSNIIKAFHLFKRMVKSSLESEGVPDFIIEPFKLTDEQDQNAGYFQVYLLINTKRYRYGFSLGYNGEIHQEWLYGPADKNETWYFKRTKQAIKNNNEWFDEGLKLPLEKLRTDTLFITFVSAYDGRISSSIRGFISNKITVEEFDMRYRSLPRQRMINSRNTRTNSLLEEGKNELVLEWLKKAGLDYTSILLEDSEESSIPVVLLQKQIYNQEGIPKGSTTLSLRENESAGTQKFYSYIGWLNEIFANGGIFISDEIDNNFHPCLLKKLIGLFNDPEVNKAGAQLLFTNHDTNLLDPEILRRDQVYFTEKSSKEETILYALSDLKGIRNNADFARQYLAGFYGALPYLGNLRNKKTDADNLLNHS